MTTPTREDHSMPPLLEPRCGHSHSPGEPCPPPVVRVRRRLGLRWVTALVREWRRGGAG